MNVSSRNIFKRGGGLSFLFREGVSILTLFRMMIVLCGFLLSILFFVHSCFI